MIENWMGITSIYLNFFKNWEVCFEFLECPLAYLFRILRLLVTKLIAGKSKYLKSMTSKLFFKLNKLLIMFLSMTTFRCNINN